MGAQGGDEVGVLETIERFLRLILFLPREASTYAPRVDRLHFFIIITTFVAATLIGIAGLYFLIQYRRRRGQQATPGYRPPWWVEPLIIGVPLSFFLLWFFLGFRDFVWLHDPPKDAMDVYVMAKQWMWKFSYPGGPNELNVLTVPQGRPVRLLLTSRDVIHSFYVPAFRIKQDVLPGRYTEIWFEATEVGHFDVLCAEYCGTGHSVMRAAVEVLPQPAFDQWLTAQRRGLSQRQDAPSGAQEPSIVEQGRKASERQGCFKCHSVDGTPHIGPTWLDLYMRQERLQSGQTVVADEAYLTESMMDPMAKIVAGYAPVMPTYQGKLSGPEAAAIVEYIKSLRSGKQTPVPSRKPTYEPRQP
jgi:cytochrome c oxidase subunit 2